MFVFYEIMKLTLSQNQTPQNQSFKSIPIRHVNLVDANGGSFIPAVFSRLNPKDIKDIKAVDFIKNNWDFDSSLLSTFHSNFYPHRFDSLQHYAIELIEDKPLEEKIVGISHISHCRNIDMPVFNKLKLSVLFTKPELNKQADDRKIKNIGEILFGQVINIAKNTDYEKITFTSLNDGFYLNILKKFGIDVSKDPEIFDSKEGSFCLRKKYYDSSLDYLQREFNIDFSQKIKKGIID